MTLPIPWYVCRQVVINSDHDWLTATRNKAAAGPGGLVPLEIIRVAPGQERVHFLAAENMRPQTANQQP